MLRDRFREWDFPLKYNKSRHQDLKRKINQRVLSLSKPATSSLDNPHLTVTLSAIGHFLDEITSSGRWQNLSPDQGVEIQKITASAHMAITTYDSDCPATKKELLEIGNRAADAISECRNLKSMHPRVLTSFLRLLVDNYKTEIESKALDVVKHMFQTLAERELPKLHPLSLLCHMKKEHASLLLERMSPLMERRLYDKISGVDSNFVAREQIYSARVLASIGRAGESIEQLTRLLTRFEGWLDIFTLADAHRTMAYAKSFEGDVECARDYAELALIEFEAAGQGDSENAMFAHMSLARLYSSHEQLFDLCTAEHHARAALSIWEYSNKGSGYIMLVKQLHRVYQQQGKTEEAQDLQVQYPMCFEE